MLIIAPINSIRLTQLLRRLRPQRLDLGIPELGTYTFWTAFGDNLGQRLGFLNLIQEFHAERL